MCLCDLPGIYPITSQHIPAIPATRYGLTKLFSSRSCCGTELLGTTFRKIPTKLLPVVKHTHRQSNTHSCNLASTSRVWRCARASASACRSLATQYGEVIFWVLLRRVCTARSFNTRAAPARWNFFYSCHAAAARCCILIHPPRRACAAAELTGRHRADPTRRTNIRVLPRRSDPEICFLI